MILRLMSADARLLPGGSSYLTDWPYGCILLPRVEPSLGSYDLSDPGGR